MAVHDPPLVASTVLAVIVVALTASCHGKPRVTVEPLVFPSAEKMKEDCLGDELNCTPGRKYRKQCLSDEHCTWISFVAGMDSREVFVYPDHYEVTDTGRTPWLHYRVDSKSLPMERLRDLAKSHCNPPGLRLIGGETHLITDTSTFRISIGGEKKSTECEYPVGVPEDFKVRERIYRLDELIARDLGIKLRYPKQWIYCTDLPCPETND